jgi:6-phosphogluconolactonase
VAELVVAEDAAAVAVGALAAWIDARLGEAPRVRLAIPGGSAVGVVGGLRRELGRDAWSRVALTWVDERVVPFAHHDSNRGAAYRAGALDAATPPLRELALVEDGESVEEALVRVDASLRDDFEDGLDALILGAGGDGHIASLFPGRPWPEGRVGHVADSPKPPPSRLTLTAGFLATAKVAALLAVGAGKAEAVARICEGDPELPTAGLAGLTVYTDEAGAARARRRA